MANNVYNYVEVSGTDEVLNKFEEMGKSLITQRETTDWEGKPMLIDEYNGIEELKFMPEFDEVHDTYYNWYCDNVGAKWCHIEEWTDDYMNLCSAWSACIPFTERLTAELAKIDPHVQVRHQYEDEFRNFIGVIVHEGIDAEEVFFNEVDDGDLAHLFKEQHPEFNHDDDEWTDEMYEAYDDLVYNWFQDQTV
tara:strand:- start:100 stop:678 length:579 start_codon:yes stop_codon:yes gene_type:complete